eukprot:CAMPEP_0204900484 /NCGR_PEP_ID=MMETSP1397-20131031/2503_1 /ASSEMBLY_ACC=CAM_ASM_000891 /TAXON_ID=49980 /ORGANISM="Climacostomum Climacostomum virens, Strain Stock W-24" /LENGTH=60 /DNA_ID=CAMNT_0052068643 /DNA_START=608 /DNA_END=787 /DNA_ORIENTATION=-
MNEDSSESNSKIRETALEGTSALISREFVMSWKLKLAARLCSGLLQWSFGDAAGDWPAVE